MDLKIEIPLLLSFECEIELSAHIFHGFHKDRSAMASDDPLDNRKADTSALVLMRPV